MEVILGLVVGFLIGLFIRGNFTMTVVHKNEEPEQIVVEQARPEDILEALSPEIKEWYDQLGGSDNVR